MNYGTELSSPLSDGEGEEVSATRRLYPLPTFFNKRMSVCFAIYELFGILHPELRRIYEIL